MVPAEGTYGPLGQQIVDGLVVFAASAEGLVADVVQEPDSCDAGGGADAASAFVEAGVDAVIGLLCMESLIAAMPILSASEIPAITLGVRSGIVSEDATDNGWLFYRMAPRADDEAQKIADAIASLWLGQPLALIEDGTIYGRELTESVRILLEEMNITPVLVGSFRSSEDNQFALLSRLERLGVTHVFVAGDRRDIAIIARDSAIDGLGMTFMGGDALNAAETDPALADDVLAITLPDYAAMESAKDVVAAFDNDGLRAEGYGLPAFAAARILLDAKRSAAARRIPLAEALRATPFDTAVGVIEFDDFGERKDNPFRLMVWQDGGFHMFEETGKEATQ